MDRPRQHEIEDESDTALRLIIPSNFVILKVDKDYGLDYWIEIFDKGKTTGKMFFIQLKVSDQEINNDTFKLQIKVKSLIYYHKILLPVLIVCHSTSKDCFWGVWANKVIDTLDSKVLNQQKVQLKFDKSHKINKSFFENLPFNDLDDISQKINIESVLLGGNAKLFHKRLLDWLLFFFPNDISLDDSTIPNTIKFEYIENDENLSIHITHKKITLHKYQIKIPENDLHFNRPSFDEHDFDERLSEAMFVLACRLTDKNISGTLKLIHKIASTNGCRVPESYYFNLMSITLQAISDNRLNDINSIMQKFTNKGLVSEANVIDIGLLMASHKNPEVEKFRVKNLRILLQNIENNEAKGTTAYNLANSIEDTRESFEYYFLAKKMYPDYLNRFYWWREVAGILFQTKHYKLAEAFYMKALDLMINYDYSDARYMRVQVNAIRLPHEFYPLIADCLFFQRKFKEASEWFEKYFKKEKEDIEWYMKKRLSDHFMKVFEDSNEFNAKKAKTYESKAFEFLEKNNKEEALEHFYSAVRLDPLQSNSWFNMGVLSNEKDDLDKTLFYFECSAIISRNDIEAWYRAFCLSAVGNHIEEFKHIALYLKKIHGKIAINQIADMITQDPTRPMKEKQKVIKVIEGLLSEPGSQT